MKGKKEIVPLVLFLVLGLLLSGCSASDSGPQEGLVVWTTRADNTGQLKTLFDRYRQAGGLPVKIETGASSKQVLKVLGSPEPPDLILLTNNDVVGFYHHQGLLEALDPWVQATSIDLDDIYAAPLAQCRAPDGTILCLPWGCDVQALFWNKDLFVAASLDPDRPPQTMEELVEYADKLTLRDGAGELCQIGFIPDYARSSTDLYARMFGGYWYSDDGMAPKTDSQAMIDAIAWQLQFYENHGTAAVSEFASAMNRYKNSRHTLYAGRELAFQECHPGSPRDKSPDGGFYEGKIAMMIGSQWQLGPKGIAHAQPELNYGVAPFPPPAQHPERANTSAVQGPVVILPVGARNKEAAAKLLAWMMSPEIVAEEAYRTTRMPTSRTATGDPRLQRLPDYDLFVSLTAHPNARANLVTPIGVELNKVLSQVEADLFQDAKGNPILLLNEVQAGLEGKLEQASAHSDSR